MQGHLQSHPATASGPDHGTVLVEQQLFLSKVLELLRWQAHSHEAEMDAVRSRVFTLEAKVEAGRSYEALPIPSNTATEASAHVQIQRLDEKLAKLSQDLTNLMSNQQGQKPSDVELDSFRGGESKMTKYVRSPVEAVEHNSSGVNRSSRNSYAQDFQSSYGLEGSVWEGVFFIGISEFATMRGQILLVCGLALNCLLQMVAVFLVSKHMIVNPYDDPVLEELRRWKDCENKTEQQLALNTGCKDIHVDVNTIWTEVNDFFTPDLPYPAGWVMSIIAITMWVSVMSGELRDILSSTLSIRRIPKGDSTCFMENDNRYTIVSVHGARRSAMLVVAVARLAIALNLLHSGTMFLTYTSCIESLIMNAVALAFVIDIDKFLFQMFAPSSVIHLMGILEPLPIDNAIRQDTKVWILFLLVFAYMAVIDIVFLRPFVHSMEDVINIINW